MEDKIVQIVHRKKPREIWYIREPALEIWLPKRGQADVRLKLAELSRESKKFTTEEIAELVGGKPHPSKKGYVIVNGRSLPKSAAYVKYMMRGYVSDKRLVKIPKWLERQRKYIEELKRLRIIAIRKTI